MRLLLLIAAVVCWLVALLVATGVVSGSSFDAWLAGGLLAFGLASLVPAGWPGSPPA